MKYTKDKSESLHIRLKKETMDKLKKIANEQNKPISQIARELLEKA